MSAEPTEEPILGDKSMFVDRRVIAKALAEFHAATGFVPDRTRKIQEVRKQMIADGVRPEDCIFSRGIIAERYPDEYPTGS